MAALLPIPGRSGREGLWPGTASIPSRTTLRVEADAETGLAKERVAFCCTARQGMAIRLVWHPPRGQTAYLGMIAQAGSGTYLAFTNWTASSSGQWAPRRPGGGALSVG
jgi:hypothetical protein